MADLKYTLTPIRFSAIYFLQSSGPPRIIYSFPFGLVRMHPEDHLMQFLSIPEGTLKIGES